MNKRMLLPGTELNVCPIAFGTVRAGVAWSGLEADRYMDTYLDMGGNVIDTARIYIPPEPGCGERIIGEWLQRSGKRHEIILMTKGGHPPLTDMHHSRLSQEDMVYDLEESLRALKTDCIDVYFYHRDDESRPVGELVERMEAFVRQGKIRYYACSNWSTRRMQEADAYAREHGLRGFIGNQAMCNIGTKHMLPPADDTLAVADEDMLRYHQASDNTLMPYSSLCNGFFHLMEKDPEKAKTKKYYTPGNLQVYETLQKIREKHGCTMSQAILGYLLTLPMPVLALAGAGKLEQLTDVMGTLDVPFTPDDYQEV